MFKNLCHRNKVIFSHLNKKKNKIFFFRLVCMTCNNCLIFHFSCHFKQKSVELIYWHFFTWNCLPHFSLASSLDRCTKQAHNCQVSIHRKSKANKCTLQTYVCLSNASSCSPFDIFAQFNLLNQTPNQFETT